MSTFSSAELRDGKMNLRYIHTIICELADKSLYMIRTYLVTIREGIVHGPPQSLVIYVPELAKLVVEVHEKFWTSPAFVEKFKVGGRRVGKCRKFVVLVVGRPALFYSLHYT
jgi:hypothetical protein